jgi:mevalonate pyrophosphate decarboxylase
MDAGPNVKVLCLAEHAGRVAEALRAAVGDAMVVGIGGDPRLL